MDKKFALLTLCGFYFLVSCQHFRTTTDSASNQEWLEVVSYAEKNLSHQGVVIQDSSGYAYLKVDDNYIHKLFPMLKAQGFKKPPYFRRANSPGAHISLIYEDEQVMLSEVGQTFSFAIKNINVVHPKKGLSFIVLEVFSPALEELRKKYGLAPLLKGHQFHITLAKKQTL